MKKGLDTPIEMNGFDEVFNDEAMQKHIKDKGIEVELKNANRAF
ncbi:hypothetical protein HpNP138_01630 [Helicobacter pylori]